LLGLITISTLTFALKAEDSRYLEMQKIAMQKLFSLSENDWIKNFDFNEDIETWSGILFNVNAEDHIIEIDLSFKDLTGRLFLARLEILQVLRGF
jgi:hypothetical protein